MLYALIASVCVAAVLAQVNLMAAWRDQLLEVLGAMGMREVRRLRGELGRAMFQEENNQQSLQLLADLEKFFNAATNDPSIDEGLKKLGKKTNSFSEGNYSDIYSSKWIEIFSSS